MNAKLLLSVSVLGTGLGLFAANRTTVLPDGDTVVIFDEPGDFTWTAPRNISNARVLIVGGGGGGGSATAGGGGGGQVVYSSAVSFTGGTAYSGSVGAGGSGGSGWSSNGGTGGTTAFLDISATGGGGGATTGDKTGRAGANSGGSAGHSGSGAAQKPTGQDGLDETTGFTWYGNHKGGSGTGRYSGGQVDGVTGGGGGAMGDGGNGVLGPSLGTMGTSGDGGAGFPSDITGGMVYYACGGGGGSGGKNANPPTQYSTPGAGGSAPNSTAGSGSGVNSVAGGKAVAGTGSGGGGGYVNYSSAGTGGAGGCGTVIIRYSPNTPVVLLMDYEAMADGKAHTIGVDVQFPAEGVSVSYADSASGPWGAKPSEYTAVGTNEVWVKASAAGLEDFVGSAKVKISSEPVTAGSYFFVVPPDTAGHVAEAPYAHWSTAATNLQDAVDAAKAASGAVIYVLSGSYPVRTTLQLTNVNAVVRSWKPNVGGLDRDGTVFDAGYPAFSNRIARLDKTCVEGLTFRNGYSTNGGGVYVGTQPASGVVMNDCVVSNCLATSYGGGIYVSNGGIVSNSVFACNVAEGKNVQGGALYAGGVTAEDCTFVGNRQEKTAGGSEGGGAAVNVGGTNAHAVRRCTFVGNVAADRAVVQLNANSTASDCVFTGNNWRNGGNMLGGNYERCVFSNETGHVSYNGSPAFRNCLFVRTSSPANLWNAGDPVYENCTFVQTPFANLNGLWTGNGPRIVNCAFSTTESLWTKNGSPTPKFNATNCCATVSGLETFGEGNFVRSNLRFVDAANGNYRLKPGSPCRDKGVTLSWMTASATDLDRNARVRDARGVASETGLPDIGCYECAEPTPGFLLIFR